MKKKLNIQDILTSENLAEDIKKDELDRIGVKVVEGFKRDKESRSGWEERNAEALKIALQVKKEKSFPWPNASNVQYPLLTVSCMQFNARAYPALVPGSRVVKHRVIGADPDGEKRARAERVSDHMNYQIMAEDESWEDEMDRLLMSESLLGSCFKKTYFDPSEGKNISEMISADNFVVDYYTRSLETSRRKTHILSYHKNELIEQMRLGIFKEYDLSESQYIPSEIKNASDEAQGITESSDREDTPFQVLEQHCYLDLDKDGYDEPYIVTVLEDEDKVLRITPRFDEKSIEMVRGRIAKIKADEYFTKFGFVPSPDGSFYDVGFGILMGANNKAVNTIINQLVDAGTLSNMQAGFISKGIRIKNGRSAFTPGEWKHVNTTGDDLRKGIVPLPVREPSQTLFQLLGLLIEAGQKIGSVSDVMQGESPGQNQPATTTMAVLEQGLKVYSSIIKRNHRALSSEFRKLYKLNARYLNPQTYFEVLDEGNGEVYQNDYFGDPKDISPVSDPNIVSDAQRLTKAEAVLGRAQAMPHLYNVYEAERRYLQAIQEAGIDTLMVPEDQVQVPTDPEMDLKAQEFQHQVETDNFKLELDAQETVVNMRKKMADTERSLQTVTNTEDKMNLEVAKYVTDAELRRAELIAKTMTERSKIAKEGNNANKERTK